MHTSAGDRTVASVRTMQVPKARKLQRSCNDTYVVTVDAMLLVLRRSYHVGSFIRHCRDLIPASKQTYSLSL